VRRDCITYRDIESSCANYRDYRVHRKESAELQSAGHGPEFSEPRLNMVTRRLLKIAPLKFLRECKFRIFPQRDAVCRKSQQFFIGFCGVQSLK
jgi:hypothetical protein